MVVGGERSGASRSGSTQQISSQQHLSDVTHLYSATAPPWCPLLLVASRRASFPSQQSPCFHLVRELATLLATPAAPTSRGTLQPLLQGVSSQATVV